MDKRLDPYIKQVYGIDENTKFEILELQPEDLLTFARLDIIAKVLYLEKKTAFDKKLYVEHIKAITKGSCVEAGNPEKNSLDAFCRLFDRLKNDIEEKGYDTDRYLVPADRNLQILDGAHRVAVSLILKRKVTVIKLDVLAADKYDYSYFEKAGMPQEYLDVMALKYISLKKDIFVANIWPTAAGHHKEIEELIETYGRFGIYKEVLLSEEGAFNYLHQIYAQDNWVGNIDDKYAGVYRKLIPCFQKKGPVRVFVFQADGKETVLELKEKIRDIFQVGKHSVHITDTMEEALLMGRLLFNVNSIKFMNQATVTRYKNSYKRIQTFWKENTYPEEDILITGSSIMALYGICEANDIDYFIWNYNGNDRDSHNKYIKYYGKDLSELIFNSHNFFYYQNHKYLTLRCLKEFKKKRGEAKDIDDLRLLNAFLEKDRNSRGQKIKIVFIRKKRRIVTAVQGIIIRFTHKTGTYNLARNLYHRVKKQ